MFPHPHRRVTVRIRRALRKRIIGNYYRTVPVLVRGTGTGTGTGTGKGSKGRGGSTVYLLYLSRPLPTSPRIVHAAGTRFSNFRRPGSNVDWLIACLVRVHVHVHVPVHVHTRARVRLFGTARRRRRRRRFVVANFETKTFRRRHGAAVIYNANIITRSPRDFNIRLLILYVQGVPQLTANLFFRVHRRGSI